MDLIGVGRSVGRRCLALPIGSCGLPHWRYSCSARHQLLRRRQRRFEGRRAEKPASITEHATCLGHQSIE
ncbi:hypothetical protein H7I93_26595 [Mycobacterium nebraskense]|nr:hypothetical protein [Mycobacterium nebraskense]